jgi:hypothetical protein
MVVDLDVAAGVGSDAGQIKPQAVGVGLAANRHSTWLPVMPSPPPQAAQTTMPSPAGAPTGNGR